MAASQRLELRHSQSLVMTPQLQQAIKLLQLSNLELAAYVEQELERNPLLDRDSRPRAEADAPDAAPAQRGDEDDRDDRSGEADWDGAPERFADWPEPQGAGPDADAAGPEQRLPGGVTLREHLLDQARLGLRDAAELAIAETLIDSLDGAGYLSAEPADLAALLGVEAEAVERVRRRLCGLEPVGVFARSLAECLALQLAERDRLDPAMQALLDNLALVERRDWSRLRKLCGVDAEDLADMLAELRHLDPRPAQAFGGEAPQPLIPDILMTPAPAGGWRLELNPATLPRLLVNTRYYAEVAERTRDKTARAYLNERLQAANWLTRALDQRAQTILKVSAALVERQRAFFDKGIRHLRPLTLREIAEAIGMHESTVSRVTTNKYIATPRGTYELKYFFTASIQGADGESHSAEAVRQRIKTLIDEESPDQVLSDDRIVTILKDEGINLARRTVAKYRETLKIPSSSRRRREKAALA
jgi:RNA polymerase sigma-54 factor